MVLTPVLSSVPSPTTMVRNTDTISQHDRTRTLAPYHLPSSAEMVKGITTDLYQGQPHLTKGDLVEPPQQRAMHIRRRHNHIKESAATIYTKHDHDSTSQRCCLVQAVKSPNAWQLEVASQERKHGHGVPRYYRLRHLRSWPESTRDAPQEQPTQDPCSSHGAGIHPFAWTSNCKRWPRVHQQAHRRLHDVEGDVSSQV